MFVINSDNTCLQDWFTTSLKNNRHEHNYTTLTSRISTITTTLSHITYRDVPETSRQPFTIIFGLIFCAIISLIALITLLIICMLRHKSISCRSILSQWRSNRQHVNSDCNLTKHKPKLKPLHLVIKHQDYLNKKEKKKRKMSYRLQEREVHQREVRQSESDIHQENDPQQERTNAETTLREVRVRFNEVVEVIDNKIKTENEIDRIDSNGILPKSNYDNKDKNVASIDKDFDDDLAYDDLTVNDIVEILETLSDVANNLFHDHEKTYHGGAV
ncbi:hypothetical protein RclHR1_05730013 [Rhizophagus clarus]|uniref:Uncharacterized protein n=1 Tax=Rhizophagus clarus TaxID=94130 RepID=A0A2Z6SG74_9GLOM|nr:hypothetical protein RclHR1_05730013 [Rhizophagus clarus]GET02438.1 hypothetical protein GLOIN_2v1791407 [Rhizophagus clarus]